MAWVETQSLSFAARHEADEADDAEAVLERLEAFRDDLSELFSRTPGDVAVVLHPSPLQLSLAQPWLPLARRIAAPASRRYFAGWFSASEVNVLAPRALDKRASNLRDSHEALALSPEHEYAHVVIGANSPLLPPPFSLQSFRSYVRWAWLCEGAAVWVSGQVRHLRPAILRRLREGGRPEFPPAPRDAFLLGGTLFSLLEREVGRRACAALVTEARGEASARAVLADAFGAHHTDVERAWRRELDAVQAVT